MQHLKTDNIGRTTPNAAPQRDAQTDSCPKGNHSILQQRRTPTRQTHVRMAEASFLSRITRHKHYTRIGKHAHSFQRHKASRKNIQANLARCVSVGAPNARRDKPRSPLTCDQHCSPHFCTRNAQPSCFHNRHHAHQTNAPFAAPLLLKNCGCFAHGHAPPPRCTLAPLLPTSPLATHAALLSLCPSPWQHFGRLLLGRRNPHPHSLSSRLPRRRRPLVHKVGTRSAAAHA